jgi:TonB family protein
MRHGFHTLRHVPMALVLAWFTVFTTGCCCDSAMSGSKELDDLDDMFEAVEQASDEMRLKLLIAGISYTAEEHGWPVGTCLDGWNATNHASAESLHATLAAASPGCASMCPASSSDKEALMTSLAMADAGQKIRSLVASCDEEGPDPVFGGAYEQWRWQMAPHDYWIVRSALTETDRRLGQMRGDRAVDLRTRLGQQIPWIAATLALHAPPSNADMAVPRSSAERIPELAPVVAVSRVAIDLDHERVALLDEDHAPTLDDALKARAAEAIAQREALEASWREPAPAETTQDEPARKEGKMSRSKGKTVQVDKADLDRQIAENAGLLADLNTLSSGGLFGAAASPMSAPWSGPDAGDLLVQCDHRTSYARVQDLLAAANDAGFRSFQLGVFNEDLGRQTVIDVTRGVWKVPGADLEVPPLMLTILITADGFWVGGAAALLTGAGGADSPSVGLAGGAHAYDGLAELLAKIGAEYPDEQSVVVAAADAVDYEVLVRTLDAAREHFPYTSLATEPDVLALWQALELPLPRPLGERVHTGTEDPAGDAVAGALSRDEISKVIGSHTGQIKYCYQSELVTSPSLHGKVVVEFVIAGTGAVSSAAIGDSTLGNAAVEQCIVDKVKRWRFPAPRGGGIVRVNYPFVFSAE